MAITITYNRDKKTATVNGALGLSSVETVAVESASGDALAAGTLCLHAPGTDAALAEWDVASGACETDTRASALTAWFAARPGHDCADFRMRLKDADGNLLDKVIEQTGVLEVTQVLANSAICKLVSGKAAVNDTVK